MSSGTADFGGDCGECTNKGAHFTATCIGGMQVGQSATVNGNSPQACVVANDGGTVYAIELQISIARSIRSWVLSGSRPVIRAERKGRSGR